MWSGPGRLIRRLVEKLHVASDCSNFDRLDHNCRKEPIRFDSCRFRTFRNFIGSVRFGKVVCPCSTRLGAATAQMHLVETDIVECRPS